jgi:Holliday junction resolvase RusA-like endonuclease
MNTLKFILPITPTAQARPRHAMINGLPMTYKSKGQKDNERTLDACLLEHRPETPLEGPLALAFVAALPVPKSASKKAHTVMLSGKDWPQKKPDLSNLCKQIEDAMTRLQFWGDDCQVVELRCRKIWAERGYWQVTVLPMRAGEGA